MLKKAKTFIAVAVLSGTVSANVQAATVTVHKGDTLWGLSRTHKTTVENIQKLNHLTTDLIQPGEVLTVGTESNYYTIKKGETLWDIARVHHISVSQLMEWNHLRTDLIFPGQTLVIFDQYATKPFSATPSKVTKKVEAVSVGPVAKADNVETQPAAPDHSQTSRVTTQKEIIVTATAYTASCDGCSGTTATGINIKANPDAKIIAVDPSVIPLGSKVYIEGFGEAIAADTGGAIKGNRIDIFIPSQQDAMNFGVKQLKITILN